MTDGTEARRFRFGFACGLFRIAGINTGAMEDPNDYDDAGQLPFPADDDD